jgi:hypothetical protein
MAGPSGVFMILIVFAFLGKSKNRRQDNYSGAPSIRDLLI